MIALEPARDYKTIAQTGNRARTQGEWAPSLRCRTSLLGSVQHTIDTCDEASAEDDGQRRQPYTGFLYAGLVLTESGPTVLEFNCRLGDPETQAVMPRMESDLIDLIEAGLDGRVRRPGVERPCLSQRRSRRAGLSGGTGGGGADTDR